MQLAVLSLLGLLAAALAPELRPGHGGDGDPTTFSFHADNRLAPLLGADGSALKAEDVARDYGKHYAVLADGLDLASVEYAWSLGYGGDHPRLQPRYQDLSRWESANVENGWIAIDPALGRFKLARKNSVAAPTRAEHRRQIVLGNLTMWRLEARGRFAFTVQEEETHAIQAYDATDPKEFRYGGYSSVGGYPFSMALGDTHAYVSGSGYLSVHDIRDLRNLRYVKTIPNNGSEKPFDLYCDAEKKKLYQNSDRGLQVFDISDGDDPVLLEIHEQVRLPWIQKSGDWLFGLEAGEGNQQIMTWLVACREGPGGEIGPPSKFPLAGKLTSFRSAIKHLVVSEGKAFVVLSTGLHFLDVRDPAHPVRLAQINDLAPVPEYYEKGSGAHDMVVNKGRLFVACGRSHGGGLEPRDSGLFRDHVDFEQKVLARSDQEIPKRYRGGLRIYDLADASKPQLLTALDDDVIGCDAITNIAVGDGVLFLGSRMVGVIAFDLSDIRKPRYLGKLSNMGEVDWARLCGDKLYAVSNGLYVMEPYPAEEAKLLGFCFTNSMLFGRSFVMNPYPNQNPDRLLFALSGTWHRQLTVADPSRPQIREYGAPPLGYGRWKGQHVFVPAGNALEVYRVDASGKATRAIRFPVEGPATHLEIFRRHLFLFSLNRELGTPVKYLQVFDIQDPEKPRYVTALKGLTDTGGMFSPEAFYYRGFAFLPGWQSSRHAGGGKGWGNFLGVRVIDLRDPENPRMHCLLHYIPRDISTDSLNCAQSFYAYGDNLYIADYWTGLHVFDIAELAEKKAWRHVATIKDRLMPWSVSSYCTSVAGYGRYLYTTHFGHVNIWEVPVESDVPSGNLSVRKYEGMVRR